MDQHSIVDTFNHLHWVDYVGLGLTSVFLALGFLRGLWWQVIRLLGLAAAVIVARWVGPVWGESIHGWSDMPADVAVGLGWTSAFLITLIASALLGMIGNRTIKAMKLSLLNRVSGALAGFTTGLLLHCAGVWGCSGFASAAWREEVLAQTWTRSAITHLADLAELFPSSFTF